MQTERWGKRGSPTSQSAQRLIRGRYMGSVKAAGRRRGRRTAGTAIFTVVQVRVGQREKALRDRRSANDGRLLVGEGEVRLRHTAGFSADRVARAVAKSEASNAAGWVFHQLERLSAQIL